jgi:DNA-binding transcriptional ArsR family regulator
MNQGQSEDDFNRARAELFEALGHPTRIKILEAMKDGGLSFSELKKTTGIESSGHLTFHLEKLDGLVRVASDGRYALTDDGREAIRLVGHRAVTGSRPSVKIIVAGSLAAGIAAALVLGALQLAFFPEGIDTSLGFTGGFVVEMIIVYPIVMVLVWRMNQWQKRNQATSHLA